MIRFLGTASLAVLALLVAACSASTQGEQQSLVDRATLTVQDMMTQTVSQDPQNLLRRAKAVMICPRIFKAGFFFGGEGGNCVLLARAGNGTWSYPAFYTIGSGSFGFQFGIEDNQLIMMILTQRGLNAVLDSQLKLGANAGIAVARGLLHRRKGSPKGSRVMRRRIRSISRRDCRRSRHPRAMGISRRRRRAARCRSRT
jgi:lipid-binding SYLF domain-containing protein